MITFTGKYTTANVMIDNVDAETQSQIVEFINHPFFAEQVVVMPDCHAGKGAVVGFTMPLPKSGKIIPAIVGVDINCGMLMLPLFEKNIPVTREELDQLIRRVVPTDTDVHDGSRGHLPQFSMERHFHWSTVNQLNKRFCMAYERHFGRQMYHTHYDYEWFLKKCAQIGMDSLRAERSIGTLGGGK